VFEAFPEMNHQHKAFVDACTDYFTGKPDKILVNVEKKAEVPEGGEETPPVDPPAEEVKQEEEKKAVEDDTESEKEELPEPKNLLEVHRLHFVVLAIENECHIVPLGAFKISEKHELKRNPAFKGKQFLLIAKVLLKKKEQN
jgi:radial spoke head protein 9